MLSVTIPIRTVSELNVREHWSKTGKRAADHRGTTRLVLATKATPPALPVHVRLVRLGPKPLDDDNCAGACKHVRDGVADWLRVDDADPRVTWSYSQEKGRYGVRIEIRGGA